MPGAIVNPAANPTTAGYFGKLPTRGDFVSGNLGREFTDPWDDWIQIALEQSRQQLGEQWLDIYLTSPMWCFALSPAICGDRAWAGVLMPSVDAVGRYFPLTIAVPLRRDTNVVSLPTTARDWFEQAEILARSCLDDEFDFERFDEQVAALGVPTTQAAAQPATEANGGVRLSDAWRYGMPGTGHPQQDYPTLLHDAMQRLLFAYGLWWTSGSARISPSYLFCQGLPPPQGYAAMLDGRWGQWGWDDRHVLDAERGTPEPPSDEH